MGSNIVLAKLASSINKPNAVTALTRPGFYRLSQDILFTDISGFGGSMGSKLRRQFGHLDVEQMRNAVLNNYQQVQYMFGDPTRVEKAMDLLLGVCYQPVANKLMNNGINCGKRNLSKLNYFGFFIPELRM